MKTTAPSRAAALLPGLCSRKQRSTARSKIRTITPCSTASSCSTQRPAPLQELTIDATLERAQAAYLAERLSIIPIDSDDCISWIDPAGYTVAQSRKPDDWPANSRYYVFELDVRNAQVRGEAYLPYT